MAARRLTFDTIEQHLKQAYALVGNLHKAYLEASPRTRRLMNQALFERLVIDDTEEITGTLKRPSTVSWKPPESNPSRPSPQDTRERPEARKPGLWV